MPRQPFATRTLRARGLLLGVLLCLSACRPGSPVATPIAYLALTDGYWQAWVIEPGQKTPRQLTALKADVSRISWFPDGKALLVNLQDGRLFKVDVATQDAEAIQAPLAGILDAVVSPKGDQATFSLSTSGSVDNNDIWLFDLATGRSRKLTSMSGLQHEPTWSADGKWVYFLSGTGGQNHDIWRVDVAGGSAEQLTVNAAYHFDLALRQDGTAAYSGNSTGAYDLWLRHPDGKTQQLTKDSELDARPSWTPDGGQLLFESTRKGRLNLWRLDLESGEVQQVTNTQDGARQPVPAPVGAEA
jgi:TolB protein